MKKTISLIMAGILMVSLCGCSPKGSGKLISQARQAHGACTVVSVTESDECTEVVLHDNLQDFDYTVRSSMYEMNLDGASFGSYENSTDTFDKDLIDHIISELRTELDVYAAADGIRYETYDEGHINTLMPAIFVDDEETGRRAGETVASLFQDYNLEGRLDGWTMYVYLENEDAAARGRSSGSYTRLGEVRLPDCVYITEEQSAEDRMISAGLAYDEGATYLRSEERPFADTGIDLDQVVEVPGESTPTGPDSQVTMYFYCGSDGREYWIADFSVESPHGGYERAMGYWD